MIVRLKNDLQSEKKPRRLSFNRAYRVLGIEADDYRILDDDEDPILYEPELFHMIDDSIPEDWITKFGEAEECYSGSKHLPWFAWTDYHDDVPEAVATIRAYLKQMQPCSWPIGDRNR